MARMRTVKDAVLLLKQEDPDTKVTEYYLRNLVLSNKIPSCRAGRKILVNYDLLIDYFNNPESVSTDEESESLPCKDYGKIRPL